MTTEAQAQLMETLEAIGIRHNEPVSTYPGPGNAVTCSRYDDLPLSQSMVASIEASGITIGPGEGEWPALFSF